MKEYNYINDIGEPKKLVVYDLKDEKYSVVLLSRRTGDCCGTGELTPQELSDYLKHYNIKE